MPEPALHLQLILPEISSRSFARLAEAIPGLRATPIGLDIPLIDLRPEEALSVCLRFGITCRGTRVVASPAPVDSICRSGLALRVPAPRTAPAPADPLVAADPQPSCRGVETRAASTRDESQ